MSISSLVTTIIPPVVTLSIQIPLMDISYHFQGLIVQVIMTTSPQYYYCSPEHSTFSTKATDCEGIIDIYLKRHKQLLIINYKSILLRSSKVCSLPVSIFASVSRFDLPLGFFTTWRVLLIQIGLNARIHVFGVDRITTWWIMIMIRIHIEKRLACV